MSLLVPFWPISHPLNNQERLYYAALTLPPPNHNILVSTAGKDDQKQIHFFNIDHELVYWNYLLDFGPLNLGQLVRFCRKLNAKLLEFPDAVCLYSNTLPEKRTNAIFLICAWQLLYLDRTPEEAYRGFDFDPDLVGVPEIGSDLDLLGGQGNGSDLDLVGGQGNGSERPVCNIQGAVTIGPLPPFHDASNSECTYDLTVLDCLRGLAKARMHGFFDASIFDVEEYEYYENVEVCEHDCCDVGRLDKVSAREPQNIMRLTFHFLISSSTNAEW